jgi:hypothetical protein
LEIGLKAGGSSTWCDCSAGNRSAKRASRQKIEESFLSLTSEDRKIQKDDVDFGSNSRDLYSRYGVTAGGGPASCGGRGRHQLPKKKELKSVLTALRRCDGSSQETRPKCSKEKEGKEKREGSGRLQVIEFFA